jgi:hypothetical protein
LRNIITRLCLTGRINDYLSAYGKNRSGTKVHVQGIDKSKVLFSSNLNKVNKSLIDLLKSNKLEKFLRGATRMVLFQSLTMRLKSRMTERCWFDSMVFSVFSNDLTWFDHYLQRKQSWKCLCQCIHARPCKRILSLSTSCHSRAVEDLMSLADPCTPVVPFVAVVSILSLFFGRFQL